MVDRDFFVDVAVTDFVASAATNKLHYLPDSWTATYSKRLAFHSVSILSAPLFRREVLALHGLYPEFNYKADRTQA